jgi:hypothetical protein
MFESTALGDTYGRAALAPLEAAAGDRAFADLRCERLHYRNGSGVCLRADRGMLTTYDAVIFDETLSSVGTIGLAGIPSRVRVSPSGARAAITVFVTGHSYADGNFSTQTTLVDLTDQSTIADLEVDFEVRRDGSRWREIDFNFWGVTFVDDSAFYATLGTGGETFLVRGDIAERTMTIADEGVECPSLSPDGTRIAFKLRDDQGPGPVKWRIAVLDLASGQRTVLAETRNVDDQVEWLDDETIMYGLPDAESPAETGTWIVPADGTGVPRLLIPRAWSATVVR